jgi:hypothetical protein
MSNDLHFFGDRDHVFESEIGVERKQQRLRDTVPCYVS